LEGHLLDLAGWVDDLAKPHVDALVARLTARELRVLLVGEAKRGKSTLGNAILGRTLLPSGVRPVTAITTSVETGVPERLEVSYLDGRREQLPLEDLALFVSERDNPSNERDVASVRAVVASSPLEPAVLVDTPGVGSVFTHNTEEAGDAMDSMDLAVFVLAADPPISQTERILLGNVRDRAVATFVVLNKVDRLSDAEVEEARAFASEVTGVEQVITCSARAGLDARLSQDAARFAASGVATLVDELVARIESGAEQDLMASVASAAARVAGAARERVRLTRAALTAVMEDRNHDVDVFTVEVGRSADTISQALASIAWETGEMRNALDLSAQKHAERTRLRLLAKLDGLASRTAGEHAERLARRAIVTVIEHDVEAWRTDQLASIDHSLSSLSARQQDHLDGVAGDVAATATRLLGVDVRPVIEPLPVPDLGGFRFDFSPAVGWNTAAIEGVRHHLPMRLRRSVMAAHLRSETITLVDRQYGRARSDLQARLETAHRQLAGEVTTRIMEQREALTSALAAATDLKDRTAEQQQARLAELDVRLDALHGLVDRLGRESP
jgi:GTP-binding protein EngB required for normal cell division/predicted nucleic acid-binding protein